MRRIVPIALALLWAFPINAQDDIPPPPLPDFGDPSPRRGAQPPPGAPEAAPLPRLSDKQAAAARAAASRHISYVRGGSRDGTYPIYDPALKRTWRLKLEGVDEAVFPAADKRAVARARFLSAEGERVVLDFPLRPTRGAWEVEEPRIWRVGDHIRYYYDAAGRVAPLAAPPQESPPWWLKLFPWLNK